MNERPTSPPHGAAGADDAAWLDAVAGRQPPPGAVGPDADDLRAAHALGAAYRAAAQRTGALHHEPDRAARQAQLLARARRAGLLAEVGPARPHWLRWLTLPAGWRSPAAAVAVMVLAVTLVALWPTAQAPRDDAVLRGTPSPAPVEVDDPRQARDQALATLRRAGVEAAPFESADGFGLDAEVPATPSPGAAEALRSVFGSTPAAGAAQRLYRPRPLPAASPASATKPAQ